MVFELKIPKKSIAFVFIILIGFITFSIILYSIPLDTLSRDHKTADVLLFSKS